MYHMYPVPTPVQRPGPGVIAPGPFRVRVASCVPNLWQLVEASGAGRDGLQKFEDNCFGLRLQKESHLRVSFALQQPGPIDRHEGTQIRKHQLSSRSPYARALKLQTKRGKYPHNQ